MVEWLAGNRIIGTTAERPALGLPSGSVGGWVELARTTLGSAGDTIDVTSLPDKRYYMVLGSTTNGSGGSTQQSLRFNGDGGSNQYGRRYSADGGGDTNNMSTRISTGSATAANSNAFTVGYVANKSDKEKLAISHGTDSNGSGAGTASSRMKAVGKWINATDSINSISIFNPTSGDFQSGSECVVLGWDPADTHTTNFWEELASESQSSSGEMTVSFTAKKYICIQYECTSLNPTATGLSVRFNSDNTSKYCRRFSQDGASDISNQVNQTKLSLIHSGGSHFFGNMFIINNASNEKLVIVHQAAKTTASGGASEVPRRWEIVGKWTNTSDQISSLTFIDTEQGSSGISKGTIKVWGSD